jgi:hypothetical protein
MLIALIFFIYGVVGMQVSLSIPKVSFLQSKAEQPVIVLYSML